ncbi:TPA: tape measure protein, partial [Proteus mirabilis]
MAQVGEIVYQVQMDVQQLLTSQRQLEQRLNRMDDSFNRTSRAVNNTEQSMLSLSKVAGVVASALSAGAIINAVDEWGQMAARIKMALNSVEGDVERYAEIQQRFLEVSNRNGKAIETTQELYAGSATSMKELGYNTTQTVDYIESLSSAFTANATGAQQTESAMNALNRAMVVGTLKGNDWHSVLNATPSVVADIAKELSRLRGGVKVTENDVKKMAMQGGISMKLFADAMIKAREENNALADSMDNTIADGFTKLTNSAKAYYGEMNQTLGITRSVSAGFAVLTDNFEKVSMVANIALAILGARMAGALYSTIKAKISDISTSINQTTATLNTAKASEYAATAAVRKAQADLSSARSAVALAQAEYNVAKGTLAEATALDNLILKKSLASKAALTLAQATQVQTAAMANSAAAAKAASLSVNLFKGALGLVGGPAGAAMLAGAAVLYFYQQAKEARENAIKLAGGVDELTAKMKEMSRVQKEAEMAELRKALPELNNELLNAVIAHSKAIGAVKDLESQVAKATPGTSKYTSLTNQLTSAQDDLAIATNNAKKASNDYSRTKSTISLIQADLNGTLKQGIELLQRETSVLPNAADGWNSYGFSIKRATQEKKDFNSQSLVVQWSDKGLDMRKSLEREAKLANAQSEVDKRLLQVKFYAEDNDLSEQEVLSLNQWAIAAQDARDAESERNSKTKESTKATDAAYEALKRQREEIELLNKGYKDGSLEMAKYDAVKSLGDKASPEQIKLAEKLAEDKYNIERNLADKKAALELDLVAKAKESHDKQLADLERITKDDVSLTEQAARRKAEIEAEYQQKIAEIKAKNAVSPQDNLKAQVDPVQQLKNEHERKLALIKEYENQKVLTQQQSLALMNAANTQYEQDRMNAQWEIWRNQSQANQFLADGLDALGQRSA